MTLCEENCNLVDYDYEKEKVKCSCDVKLFVPLIEDIKFNKDEFIKSFTDIKNVANLNVMKCYNYVFNKSLIKNYGFFIMTFMIIFYFICLIIFRFKSFDILKDDINHIFFALKINHNKSNFKKNTTKKIKKKKKKKKKKKRKIGENKELGLNLNNNKKSKDINEKIDDDNNNKQITINEGENSNNMILGIKNGRNIINNDLVDINNNYKQILEYKDFELNSLDYEEALSSDKRNYIQFYISLLKNNHPIIFSFFPYKDYNSRTIKIFLFFFSFCSNLVINALFFNDDTMHKIYIDEGDFNFIYQLPQIIISSLISGIIGLLIKYLALSQENISKFKQANEHRDLDKDFSELLRTLKNKFVSFFIIIFLLLVFFWYYISCFCGVYVNTQEHLLKDTTFSFLSSLIYPFGFYLLPGIFRISALKSENKFLYKFASIIEFLVA